MNRIPGVLIRKYVFEWLRILIFRLTTMSARNTILFDISHQFLCQLTFLSYPPQVWHLLTRHSLKFSIKNSKKQCNSAKIAFFRKFFFCNLHLCLRLQFYNENKANIVAHKNTKRNYSCLIEIVSNHSQ